MNKKGKYNGKYKTKLNKIDCLQAYITYLQRPLPRFDSKSIF